jgi:hypothetical protein
MKSSPAWLGVREYRMPDEQVASRESGDPGTPGQQPVLTARRFQAAVHREWLTPNGTIVSVWLIQFGTAADARSYILSTEQADTVTPASKEKFRVAGVRDGLGFAGPALDKHGNTFTCMLGDAGNISMIIHVFIPARTDNAFATQVLQARCTAKCRVFLTTDST